MPDDGLDEQRRLVDFARRYAIEELGLNIGNLFEREDFTQDTFYTVYWSPSTKIKSNYKRYGSKPEADDKKKELNLLGNDAYVREWEAYGGEDCPITKSLLNASPERIVYVVPHEKWHVFVKQYQCRENLMIEEATGDAIALNEGINIIKRFYGENSKEYEDAVKYIEYFRKRALIIKSLGRVLNELYESGKSESEILEEKNKAFQHFNKMAENMIGYEIKNNARLADFYMYDALFPLTDDIYSRCGKDAINIFYESMRLSKERGFRAGVEELIKHSTLKNKEEYRNVINVFG